MQNKKSKSRTFLTRSKLDIVKVTTCKLNFTLVKSSLQSFLYSPRHMEGETKRKEVVSSF